MKYYHIKDKDSLLKSSESFLFTGEYVVDEGAAKSIVKRYVAQTANRKPQTVFIADRFVTSEYAEYILGNEHIDKVEFSGEINPGEFHRIKELCIKYDTIICAGGGKVIDLCKLIKNDNPEKHLLCIPTSAATCSAFTPVSVMYDKEGVYMDILESGVPDKIIIDYEIFYKLPKSFLASGVIDTIAKYYETSFYRNFTEDKCILDDVLFAVAEEIYEKAKLIIQRWENLKKADIRELTDINIFFSGLVSNIGRYCITSSFAHIFAHAMTASSGAREFLHGEHVGLGLLIQESMVDNKKSIEEIRGILTALDIPCRMEGFGIKEEETPEIFKLMEKFIASEKIEVPIEKELMYNIISKCY